MVFIKLLLFGISFRKLFLLVWTLGGPTNKALREKEGEEDHLKEKVRKGEQETRNEVREKEEEDEGN